MNPAEYSRLFELEDHYWWFVARRRLALGLIQKFAPEAKTALDLGCGAGAMLAELANRYDATGLDVSEQSKKLCESRGLRNVVLADGADMPFEDNKFDVVVTLDTIEHIDDDALTVNQILRVLNPGGVVVANVPAFRWLWGPHDIALHHKRRYTKAEFNSLFKQAGFEVELVSYSVFWLFPIVVLRRMLERFSRGEAKVRMPVVGKWFNRALIRLMDLEGRGLVRHGWPWGSSVVIVAKKPA